MRTGYGHVLQDHLVERVRALHAERRARLAALATPSEARAYRTAVRRRIRAAFGPWPERTPLNPRIAGALERPAYRIEKVLFESRPGLVVTANLYLPRDLRAPAPAVLGSCGHSANGKASALYQGFCQRLARAGFVVLIYDPINQGERDQYAPLAEREAVRACTAAHNMMGKQMELLGDFFGAWRAWDGIRALDYLLSRPEVDPTRVGLTGNSGGGTMSTWLWALDERFTMAGISCFITTFLRNLENELAADCEQYPPGVLTAPMLEMADFVIAAAPKPVILMGEQYDFFDRRGFAEALGELQQFYTLWGAPRDCVGSYLGPASHGYWREPQEAMVRFFTRQAGLPEPASVPQTEVVPDADLWAAPRGDVLAAGARPVYEMLAEEAERLAAVRRPLQGATLRRRLRVRLHLPPIPDPVDYRILRPSEAHGLPTARYAIESEPPVRAILHKRGLESERCHSLDVERTVYLYLPHLAAEDEFWPREEGPAYALDVRGLGEARPDEEGPFLASYGLDYMHHGHYLLLGESLLGRRVHDVLCALALLRQEGASEIYLTGRGQGAILALLAGVVDGALTSVTLINAPGAWSEWLQAPLVAWPAANGLCGALHDFDLPDLVAALGQRVRLYAPWDAHMQPTGKG